MEDEELAAARAAAEAEFNSRKPDETPGSEDTDIRGAQIRTPRRVAFAAWMKNLVDDLVADASGDSAAALARCRRTLLVQPLTMIVSDQVRLFFANLTTSISAIEVYVEVLLARVDSVVPMLGAAYAAQTDTGYPPGCSNDEETRGFVLGSLMLPLAHKIGELFEAKENFLAAIPWYEKCVGWARANPRPEGFANVPNMLHNCSLATKNAGLLREGLAGYGACTITPAPLTLLYTRSSSSFATRLTTREPEQRRPLRQPSPKASTTLELVELGRASSRSRRKFGTGRGLRASYRRATLRHPAGDGERARRIAGLCRRACSRIEPPGSGVWQLGSSVVNTTSHLH